MNGSRRNSSSMSILALLQGEWFTQTIDMLSQVSRWAANSSNGKEIAGKELAYMCVPRTLMKKSFLLQRQAKQLLRNISSSTRL
jgi:hypothetical protein